MTDTLIYAVLLIVILPAWLLVGLADWYCHRRSDIAHTTGVRESILHLVLSFQASIAVLAGMFFEINALILAIIVGAFAAHEVTTNIDIRIALPARAFTPLEQRLHHYLTAIPLLALGLVLATHINVVREAFAGAGDWSLRWKSEPLPTTYLVGWNVAAVVLNIVPYTEELLRCFKARRAR